jgi:hypothetical protein
MSKTRTELDWQVEERDLTDALLSAKKGKDPGKLRKAKDDLRAFRQERRAVREADGSTATPDTVGLKAKGN